MSKKDIQLIAQLEKIANKENNVKICVSKPSLPDFLGCLSMYDMMVVSEFSKSTKKVVMTIISFLLGLAKMIFKKQGDYIIYHDYLINKKVIEVLPDISKYLIVNKRKVVHAVHLLAPYQKSLLNHDKFSIPHRIAGYVIEGKKYYLTFNSYRLPNKLMYQIDIVIEALRNI